MSIGEYIKSLRIKKNFSINQLSKYANVSSAHISRIERGLRYPSPGILKKIAPVLQTDINILMSEANYIYLNSQESYRMLTTEIIECLLRKGVIHNTSTDLSEEKIQWIVKLLDKAIDLNQM